MLKKLSLFFSEVEHFGFRFFMMHVDMHLKLATCWPLFLDPVYMCLSASIRDPVDQTRPFACIGPEMTVLTSIC